MIEVNTILKCYFLMIVIPALLGFLLWWINVFYENWNGVKEEGK